MKQPESKHIRKAISLIAETYDTEKMANYLTKEIDKLKNKEVDVLKYGSAGDEVDLNLYIDRAVLKFNYWDDEEDDFVVGSGEIPFSIACELLTQYFPTRN